MKLYNRYLLHKITSYFLIIATVLICLIWFNKAISFIKFITEKGIGFSEFVNLFILVLPWLALLIVPISLFVAVLITYDRMLANNELTILKNSGLSKFNIAQPAVWAAILCCLICYLMSFYLMPLSNKKLRLARGNFEHNYANIMISPGIFESLNNLTIYVKNRNSKNELLGILIYDNRNSDYAITITAKNGNIGGDGDSVLLYLNNGTAQKFNFATQKSEILKFDDYVVNLNDNKMATDSEYKWKARERYIGELINPGSDTSSEELAKYRVELHHRIIYPTFSLVLTLIAAGFSLSGQFSRRGKITNIIGATIVATLFIIITMSIYDLLEKSIKFLPLLYANLVIFIIVGLILLRSRLQKIKSIPN